MKCPYCNHEMSRTVKINGKQYKIAGRKTIRMEQASSRQRVCLPIPVLIVKGIPHA